MFDLPPVFGSDVTQPRGRSLMPISDLFEFRCTQDASADRAIIGRFVATFEVSHCRLAVGSLTIVSRPILMSSATSMLCAAALVVPLCAAVGVVLAVVTLAAAAADADSRRDRLALEGEEGVVLLSGPWVFPSRRPMC